MPQAMEHIGKPMRRWGRRDLNPHALRHMILSHACLPIPALPQKGLYRLYDMVANASIKRVLSVVVQQIGHLIHVQHFRRLLAADREIGVAALAHANRDKSLANGWR